jgi:peptidoglycan/LPS O-acetylase OafA/YrhL
MAVVGFHAFPRFVAGGFIGVDIFFVISGFLISTIILSKLKAGDFSFVDFYVRRARRIFPALLAVLAACAVAGWVLLVSGEYKTFGKHLLAAGMFVSNFLLWHESGYFDIEADTKPLLHLWSLAIEEQFYLLWPLLLVFASRRKGMALAVTAALAVASYGFCIYATFHTPVAAFFSPVSRWWELMLGGLLAQHVMHRGMPGGLRGDALAIAGATLIAAALLLIDVSRPFPGWWALAPTMGTFMLLLAGPDTWLNRVVLSHRLLVGCGLISYPLYLWHWPILSFARIWQSQPLGTEARVGAIVLSIVLAALTYQYVERPLRGGGPQRRLAFGLAAFLAAVGTAGGAIYAAGGFAFRPVLDQVRTEIVVEEVLRQQNACTDFPAMPAALATSCISHVNPSGRSRVVMWGDSHVGVWTLEFEELARRKGFELFAFRTVGCPPLAGVRRSDVQGSGAACTTLETSREKFDSIMKLNPDVVVLIARWPLYAHGWLRNGELLRETHFLTTDPAGVATLEGSGAALAETIPAMIKQMQERKIGVVVFKNPPELKWTVANLRKSVADLTVSAAEHEANSRLIGDILAPLRGIDVIDPGATLCRSDCQVVIDGRYVYSDDNHLSVFGAHLFESELERVLTSQLQARGRR